jgi:hypothetical protein
MNRTCDGFNSITRAYGLHNVDMRIVQNNVNAIRRTEFCLCMYMGAPPNRSSSYVHLGTNLCRCQIYLQDGVCKAYFMISVIAGCVSGSWAVMSVPDKVVSQLVQTVVTKLRLRLSHRPEQRALRTLLLSFPASRLACLRLLMLKRQVTDVSLCLAFLRELLSGVAVGFLLLPPPCS